MKKPGAFALIKRFYPHTRRHNRYVWVSLVCLIVATPLSAVSPILIQRLIDAASGAFDRDRIFDTALLLCGLSLVSVALGIVNGFSTRRFHVKVIRDLRLRLFRHAQALSLRFYHDRETGWVMSRLTDDVGSLGGVMADQFARVAVDVVRAVIFTAMLFVVEWRLATGGLIVAGLIFGFEYLVSPGLRKRSELVNERHTKLSEALHQGLSGHALVRATASERREAKRYSRTLHEFVRAVVSRDLFSLFTDHVFHLIAGIAPTLIILAGVYLIAAGGFTVGGLFAFFMYLAQMMSAVGSIAGMNPALQASLAALGRIFEILDTRPEVASPVDGRRPETLAGAVRFEGVVFGYDAAKPVLHGIDVDVRPRTTVALVGPSGAGKTTFIQLLGRFYDPQQGRITIDGIDLRDLDLSYYRRRLGIVPQDIFLFDRTIAENIAYGRPRAAPSEIAAAARAANALDFIEKLEKGFETVIGERGVKLSGGQRQRLAIARELLRDPAVLILDEATSSLDSESEALIQDALVRLLAGRTSFVIAHRLSTVMRADVILVLDQGRIVERGRHTDLAAAGGLYARLFESQFKRPLDLAERSREFER